MVFSISMDLTQLIFLSLNIICMFYPKLLRLVCMSQPTNYLIWNYFIRKSAWIYTNKVDSIFNGIMFTSRHKNERKKFYVQLQKIR